MCQIWTLPLKVCKEKYTFSIKLGDIKKKEYYMTLSVFSLNIPYICGDLKASLFLLRPSETTLLFEIRICVIPIIGNLMKLYKCRKCSSHMYYSS